MKHLNRVFTLLILVSASLSYFGCGGSDDKQSEEETQLNKLKSDQWTLQSASDPSDRTAEYPGMKLTITGNFSENGTYHYTSTANSWPSVSPWKKEDDWKFQSGAVGSIIVRQSDLQVINYTLSNSDKTLTLNFIYPDNGPGFNNGRTESVSGNWTFVFTRP